MAELPDVFTKMKGKTTDFLRQLKKMTRYLQRILKLCRHALESVNKFPEVLICRKTPDDNNQGLVREKLWSLKTNTSLKTDHL